MKKSIIMLLLSISMFFGWKNMADAKEIYIDMCKLAEKNLGKKLDCRTLRLGDPYIIYDVEKKDEQDAVFYFPIESGEHVYLTLEVIQTDEGMKGGISPATGIYQKKSLYENSIFFIRIRKISMPRQFLRFPRQARR